MASDAPAWVPDAIFYQVFPDRFARSTRVSAPGPLEDWDAPPTVHGFKGGNLPGLVERLDHLTDLGVNAIYLNPAFASASNHRYHTYDYRHVDPLLGGDAALVELFDEAHRRGMRVVLDGVFNHSGRGFWPFHHVLEAGDRSPYLDWFHVDAARLRGGRQIVAYPEAAGSTPDEAWAREHRAGEDSFAALGYRAWWDLPALPKLNLDNPQARAYLLDVAEHWIRAGADGWRLDVPEEVDPAFWHELRERVRRVDPNIYLVGEVWHIAPDWTAPSGPFDGLMNYPLAWAIIGFAGAGSLDLDVAATQPEMHRNLRPIAAGEFVSRVRETLLTYPAQARMRQLNVLGSHDTPRLLTVCGGDVAAVRLAILLQMAMPGAPCIYYGDEIGMTGHGDPDNRGGFPWAGERWIDELWQFARSAIRLRLREPALRGDELEFPAAESEAMLMRRGSGADELWVAVNAGSAASALALAGGRDRGMELLLGVGEPPRPVDSGGMPALLLPARSGAVLRLRT